jgi:predicted enzyme related to lactoylglutathione lyase
MGSPVVHFEATGKDGAKLRDFYGKVFGWQFQVMPEMDYGLVDNGGKGINGGIGGGPQAGGLFYAAVADPQATLDQVESLGGKTVTPVTEIPNIVTFAQFTDPEGNLIGIVKDEPGQEPPPSSAKPAENPVTWFEIVGKDSKKLREFYGKIFGWKYNVMEEMDYGMIDAEPGRGIGGGVGGTQDNPHAIFYAEVADPQAALDKVAANGGKVAMPATDGGMVTFGMFTDPEGNLAGVFKSNQQ